MSFISGGTKTTARACSCATSITEWTDGWWWRHLQRRATSSKATDQDRWPRDALHLLDSLKLRLGDVVVVVPNALWRTVRVYA